MSNKYRKRNGEAESERRKEPSISAQVEVSGTAGVCDAGRMSSLVLWCSHCAPTVLRSAGQPEPQQ